MISARFSEIYVILQVLRIPLKIYFELHVSDCSCARWEFMTRHLNIGFGVFYKPSADAKRNEWEEVEEKARCSCHFVPEIGGLSCTKLGTCEFIFHSYRALSLSLTSFFPPLFSMSFKFNNIPNHILELSYILIRCYSRISCCGAT